MKLAAVSYISFFDNDLVTRIVKVHSDNWKDALALAVHKGLFGKNIDFNNYLLNELPDDLIEAKTEVFNSDMMFEVVFIEV